MMSLVKIPSSEPCKRNIYIIQPYIRTAPHIKNLIYIVFHAQGIFFKTHVTNFDIRSICIYNTGNVCLDVKFATHFTIVLVFPSPRHLITRKRQCIAYQINARRKINGTALAIGCCKRCKNRMGIIGCAVPFIVILYIENS